MKRSCLVILLFLLAIGGSMHAQQVLTICSAQLPCPGFPLGSVQAGIDSNGWRNFKLTLIQNVTSFSFVGTPPPAQAAVNVIFTQDSTGGRTVTFASNISNPCSITASANATTLCQFEYDGIAGIWFGVSANTIPLGTPAQVPVMNGSGAYTPQSKLVVDMRDADPFRSGSVGVKCDGVTDDTAAIQAYYSYYGNGGAGATQGVQLQFPAGTCKISNQTVFEGNNGLGIRILGQAGWGSTTPATQFAWFGPNFGTMMLMLGCNNCSVENIDFSLSPTGGGQAQNGLWWDASNTVAQVAYNISSITRSGNIVTVTTTAAHTVTADRIVKVAGSTGGSTSFNGTFQVLYSNSNTTISWVQNGANESGTASTGTVTNYQSKPANNLGMTRVKISSPKAVSSSISAIQGTASSTALTTSTAHFINLGDTVIVRSVTDTSYNCAWLVSAVGSSTTATLKTLPGTGCAPSNAASSGGTVLSGSSGIRFGHVDTATEQVSQVMGRDIFIQGDQLGGSINCLEADNAGNVKNFEFANVIANGCRYGFDGFNSGNFNVWGYNGGLVTPDSSTQLASIDFVNNTGQVTIHGAEIESTNDRFFVNTAVIGNTAHLDGISFQASAPTDDLVVEFGGQMFVSNSYFKNGRAANAVPYFSCGNPLFGSNSCGLVSHGNFYANSCLVTTSGGYCSATGSSNAPGYLPFKDGSGNTWMQLNAFFTSRTANIESIGDFSSSTNDNTPPTGPLNIVVPRLVVGSDCFSSASPAVCVSATSGSAALAAAATTEIVNTTSLTPNATIILTRDNSLGTKLGVTCNTQSSLVLGTLYTSARTAGTSFTVSLDVAPTTNPVCFNWEIIGAD